VVCTPSVSGSAPAFGTVVAQNPAAGVSMFFTRQITLTVYRETC
jgi:beta-lactam-binding protein with PASTA domain